MLNLSFKPYQMHQQAELAHWLASETWHYHAYPSIPHATAQRWVASGKFDSDSNRTFWIELDGWQHVGLIRLYQLHTVTPAFDIRITRAYRGCGIGTQSVVWLIDYLFAQMPTAQTIVAATREDNLPMRRVLRHCGFHKAESHSQIWQDDLGICHDVICYRLERG